MLRVGAAVVLTIVTLAQECEPPPGPSADPNIVFVALDDARHSDLDRVADLKPGGGFDWVRDNGVRFHRMWLSNNLCCPARTTMLNGRTTYNHGVLENDFIDLQDSLPLWLQNAGYCTGFTGKWLNGYHVFRPRPAGWTHFEPLTGSYALEYGYTIMRRNGTTWNPGVFETDHLATVSRVQLQDCLNTGSPAFVTLWPFTPHSGADPEPDYASVSAPWANPDPTFNELDLSDKPPALQAQYPQPHGPTFPTTASNLEQHRARTMLSVDDALKLLIDTLAARGELGNTLFVLTSDNGYFLGEHRIYNRKSHAYEAGQSPLWIAGPGFPQGATSDAYVTNLDLAPTLRDAGHAGSPWLDGRTIQSVLTEPDVGHDRFLAFHVPDRSEAGLDDAVVAGDGVRTWRYKYTEYVDGSAELYDLALDPFEETSVVADPQYASIVAEMDALLGQAIACRAWSCRASAPAHLQS